MISKTDLGYLCLIIIAVLAVVIYTGTARIYNDDYLEEYKSTANMDATP